MSNIWLWELRDQSGGAGVWYTDDNEWLQAKVLHGTVEYLQV